MSGQRNSGAVLDVAIYAARLLLQYGGETYRAEDSIQHICRAQNIDDVEAVALSTSIMATVKPAGEEPLTRVMRLRQRTIDLGRLVAVNGVVRALSHGEIAPSEGLAQLQEIASEAFEEQRRGQYPPMWLCTALSSGFFALMVGGNAYDFLIASLCGGLSWFCTGWLSRRQTVAFMTTLATSLLAVSMAVIGLSAAPTAYFGHTIVGTLMPLFPGLSMSAAVRDSIQGDLLAGIARGADALLTAIALGVGAVLAMRVFL